MQVQQTHKMEGEPWKEAFCLLKPPSAITKEDIMIPNNHKTCFLLHNVLSHDECEFLIRETETLGYQSLIGEYSPSYRNNDRVMVTDIFLTELLWSRYTSVFFQRTRYLNLFSPFVFP